MKHQIIIDQDFFSKDKTLLCEAMDQKSGHFFEEVEIVFKQSINKLSSHEIRYFIMNDWAPGNLVTDVLYLIEKGIKVTYTMKDFER